MKTNVMNMYNDIEGTLADYIYDQCNGYINDSNIMDNFPCIKSGEVIMLYVKKHDDVIEYEVNKRSNLAFLNADANAIRNGSVDGLYKRNGYHPIHCISTDFFMHDIERMTDDDIEWGALSALVNEIVAKIMEDISKDLRCLV